MDLHLFDMKAFINRLKLISLFFISIIMFQSCVGYQSTSISLEQAAKEQKRTKIRTSSNNKYYYEKIVLEEGQFYGIKKLNKNMVKIPLDTNEINDVYLQSKSKSSWMTIVAIAIPVIALVFIALDEVDNSFSSSPTVYVVN